MAAMPRARRWTDPRDGSEWEIVFAPGVEEDTPAVRNMRRGILFRGEQGEYHAPAAYGWDLEGLTEPDLQGLLDQARERIHGGAARAPRPEDVAEEEAAD
jgi:hypothetical protein